MSHKEYDENAEKLGGGLGETPEDETRAASGAGEPSEDAAAGEPAREAQADAPEENKDTDRETDGVADKDTEEDGDSPAGDDKNKDGKKPGKRFKNMFAFTKKRNFRFGTMATVITAIVIAVVILINFVLTVVINKYPLSLDLTNNKDFNLSSDTINYLKKVKTPITIDVIDTLSDFQSNTSSGYKYVYNILKQYPQHNSNINVKYINLNENPTFKSQYSKESFSTGDILVVNGSRYKHLTSSDYFETSTDSSTYQTTITGNESEQALTSALLYVTNTNLPKVLFTTGHGEDQTDSTTGTSPISGYESLLTKNNYEVTAASIISGSIDSSYNMLVIVDPTVDFTSNEISAIDKFLQNGGKYGKGLMVYLSPSESTLPNLENYLSNYWGIKAGTGFVYDKTNNEGQYYYPLGTNLDTTVFAKVSTSIPLIMPAVRPLTLNYTTRNDNTTSSLIKSYDSSCVWVPKNSKDTTFNPKDTDQKGPFTIMAMSTKTISGGENLLYSRVVVSGSNSMIDSSILGMSSFSNQEVALAAANYLGGYTPDVSITAKSFSTSTLTISTSQIYLFGMLFLVVLPLIVIVIGIVVWLRRRHL